MGDRGSDLTWNEVHHAMVPLLKADNRKQLALISSRTIRSWALPWPRGASMYSAWSAGRLPTRRVRSRSPAWACW